MRLCIYFISQARNETTRFISNAKVSAADYVVIICLDVISDVGGEDHCGGVHWRSGTTSNRQSPSFSTLVIWRPWQLMRYASGSCWRRLAQHTVTHAPTVTSIMRVMCGHHGVWRTRTLDCSAPTWPPWISADSAWLAACSQVRRFCHSSLAARQLPCARWLHCGIQYVYRARYCNGLKVCALPSGRLVVISPFKNQTQQLGFPGVFVHVISTIKNISQNSVRALWSGLSICSMFMIRTDLLPWCAMMTMWQFPHSGITLSY